MSNRLWSLSRYLFLSTLLSLSGLMYFMLALAFYVLFLDPRQRTPDVDYYTLAIGLFGGILSFLTCLSVASRANRAVHFPLLVRLPSRVEYLAAVMMASLGFSLVIQLTISVLALIAGGPDLTATQVLELPPVWLATNILFVVLALHASDLVTSGWSRVYLYGMLAMMLYIQSDSTKVSGWFGSQFSRLGSAFLNRGINPMATVLFRIGEWLTGEGLENVRNALGSIFWPFDALTDAVVTGRFTLAAAMAPAIIVLYATLLFALAARYFARKDLFLVE